MATARAAVIEATYHSPSLLAELSALRLARMSGWIFRLAAMSPESPSGILERMELSCLIVDDNGPFLETARRIVEGDGIVVVGVASTSAEALQRIRELRPEVALVDIDLGRESGFALARRIAALGGLAPRVIMMSAHPGKDFVDLIDSSPAIGFLSKSELSARAVRELLR
jgi:CheY-like chemotaxis protein